MVQRDTIINSNTLLRLGRSVYTDEDINKIKKIKEKQEKYFASEKDI